MSPAFATLSASASASASAPASVAAVAAARRLAEVSGVTLRLGGAAGLGGRHDHPVPGADIDLAAFMHRVADRLAERSRPRPAGASRGRLVLPTDEETASAVGLPPPIDDDDVDQIDGIVPVAEEVFFGEEDLANWEGPKEDGRRSRKNNAMRRRYVPCSGGTASLGSSSGGTGGSATGALNFSGSAAGSGSAGSGGSGGGGGGGMGTVVSGGAPATIPLGAMPLGSGSVPHMMMSARQPPSRLVLAQSVAGSYGTLGLGSVGSFDAGSAGVVGALLDGRSPVAAAADELFLGGIIADVWELGKVIARGGNSAVREATRAQTGEKAAVKVLEKDGAAYSEKLVCREVFTHRLLTLAGGDEHIAQCKEVWEDVDCVYIVMELLEGGELFQRISEAGPYTEKDAARLVVSMLEALSCCHRLNITHRDVKPENFVFSSNPDAGLPDGSSVGQRPNLKLIDFGISFYTEDPSAMCRTLCGTPLYVAPEVFFRQPYGPEADMWALGVIVYIMLVGYPPFDDDDMKLLVKKVKFQPVKFDLAHFSTVSNEAKAFLACLLDKDPSNRMTAQQALDHPWLRNSCLAASEARLDVVQKSLKQLWEPHSPPSAAPPACSPPPAWLTPGMEQSQPLYRGLGHEPEPPPASHMPLPLLLRPTEQGPSAQRPPTRPPLMSEHNLAEREAHGHGLADRYKLLREEEERSSVYPPGGFSPPDEMQVQPSAVRSPPQSGATSPDSLYLSASSGPRSASLRPASPADFRLDARDDGSAMNNNGVIPPPLSFGLSVGADQGQGDDWLSNSSDSGGEYSRGRDDSGVVEGSTRPPTANSPLPQSTTGDRANGFGTTHHDGLKGQQGKIYYPLVEPSARIAPLNNAQSSVRRQPHARRAVVLGPSRKVVGNVEQAPNESDTSMPSGISVGTPSSPMDFTIGDGKSAGERISFLSGEKDGVLSLTANGFESSGGSASCGNWSFEPDPNDVKNDDEDFTPPTSLGSSTLGQSANWQLIDRYDKRQPASDFPLGARKEVTSSSGPVSDFHHLARRVTFRRDRSERAPLTRPERAMSDFLPELNSQRAKRSTSSRLGLMKRLLGDSVKRPPMHPDSPRVNPKRATSDGEYPRKSAKRPPQSGGSPKMSSRRTNQVTDSAAEEDLPPQSVRRNSRRLGGKFFGKAIRSGGLESSDDGISRTIDFDRKAQPQKKADSSPKPGVADPLPQEVHGDSLRGIFRRRWS